MPSSGEFVTTNNDNVRNVKLVWSSTQDVNTNKSTITWQLIGASDGSSGFYYAGPFWLKINNTVVVNNLYPSGQRIQLHANDPIASGTIDISHDNNGAANLTIDLQAQVYYASWNCQCQSSVALPTIARASGFDSTASYAVGSNRTVTVVPKSSSFSHVVLYALSGGSQQTIGTIPAGSTTISWNLNSSDVLSYIGSLTEGSATLYLKTMNGSTQVGATVEKTVALTVPSYTLSPSCSFSDDTIAGQSVYFQNLSTIKATISNASSLSNYGATPTYALDVGDTEIGSGTSSPFTSNTLTMYGDDLTLTLTVTDSRGITGTATQTISIREYSRPKITAAKMSRNDTTITVTVSASASSVMGGTRPPSEINTLYVYVVIKEKGGTYPTPSSSDRITNTSRLLLTNGTKTFTSLASQTTYLVNVIVRDYFGQISETSRELAAGDGGSFIHITESAIGIGKYIESGYALDVNGKIRGINEVIANNISSGKYVELLSVYSSSGAVQSQGVVTGVMGDSSNWAWLIHRDVNGNVYVDNKVPLYVPDFSISSPSWTPTFSWSSGSGAPTIAGSNCRCDVCYNMAHYYGYFQITALGSGTGQLQITTPSGITNKAHHNTGMGTRLEIAGTQPSVPLLIRVMADKLVVGGGPAWSSIQSQLHTGWCSFDLWTHIVL
jgi:hypothetical protein